MKTEMTRCDNPDCPAEDGLPCVTKNGNIKPDFHAPRRKRGIERMREMES